jgi:hypothetical protein
MVSIDPNPQAIRQEVTPGDTVKVMNKNNKQFEFRVTKVSSNALISGNYRILLNQIKYIEKRKTDAVKTTEGAAIIVPIVAAAAVTVSLLLLFL